MQKEGLNQNSIFSKTSSKLLKLQDAMNQVLDKIRAKVHAKSDEAKQMLEKYNLMLEFGAGKLNGIYGGLDQTKGSDQNCHF